MIPVGAIAANLLRSGGGGGSFSPDDITALEAWYDVSTFSGSDGDPIATWTDSKNSWDGTDAGTQKATLQTAEQNGLNVAQFAPSGSNWPNVTMNANLMHGAPAGMFFAVFKLESDPPAGTSRGGAILDGFGGSTDCHHPFTDGVIYDGFGSSVGRFTVGNPTPNMASTYRIYAARSAINDWKAFLDGTQIFSNLSLKTPFWGASPTTKYLGRNKGSLKFAGFIAEILIFADALVQADREKVEGYLAHKWGIAANLDAGHPYKSSPP